jgi:hypothetical protein
MSELSGLGLSIERFDIARVGGYEAVVFSKIYDERAIAAAKALQAAGARVVLDLCDNHFYGEDSDPFTRERTLRLERMIREVDLIVSSTPVLEAQLRERFPAARDRMRLIPDYLEDEPAGRLSLFDHLALKRMEYFFERTPRSLRLIWFGNHGGGRAAAGMADLSQIRSLVEAQAGITPLTLTVMSNSYGKYRRLVSRWAIPSTYVTWTAGRADAILRRHDVAVLPINRNPFTLAKTINRPATAILAGLGVIADAIPSYEELRSFVPLDDWEGGLRRYANRRPSDDPAVAEARTHLLQTYGRDRISDLWRAALKE